MNDFKAFIVTGVVAIILIAGIAFVATLFVGERGPAAADLPDVPPPPSFIPPDPNATTSLELELGVATSS